MEQEVPFEMIDGIKCYNPEVAQNYKDYPNQGFDLTDQFEAANFWFCSRSRLLKYIIRKYSPEKTNLRFLEIGCGTGFFLRELAENTHYQITGSDIYLGGLKYAQEKLPNTTFIQLDATVNPVFDEKYNVIGAFDVLEHIEDDQAVMANVYQSLHENGCFILTVPQYPFLWSKLDQLVKHKRRYNRSDLTAQLKECGFDIVFASSFIFILFPFMLISRLLDRKQSTSDEFSGIDFEKRVKLPRALNWIFNRLMYIDEYLIRWGFSLPFGGSLLVVARKKKKIENP